MHSKLIVTIRKNITFNYFSIITQAIIIYPYIIIIAFLIMIDFTIISRFYQVIIIARVLIFQEEQNFYFKLFNQSENFY